MRDVYNHLRAFGLAKRGDIKRRLEKLPEKRLIRFLEDYLDIARQRPLAITAAPGATDIYPDSCSYQTPITIIKQLSIYSNHIYIHDPLVRTALAWSHLDSAQNVIKHHSRDDRVASFKLDLAYDIEKLLEIQPLVKAGIVHLTPTDLTYPRREPNALFSNDFFGPRGPIDEMLDEEYRPEPLPANFVRYYKDRMMVSPARYINNEPRALLGEQLVPQRMIAMGFPGDPLVEFFQLFDIFPYDAADDPEGRRIRMHFNPNDTFNPPVDPSMFWSWVEAKKREVASERLHRLTQDLVVASMAKARFITDLPTSDELAQLTVGTSNDEEEKKVRGVLHMDLPFFNNVDLNAIVSARRNEVAFEEFRIALDKAFKAIKEEAHSPIFQKRVDEITRDLLHLPLLKIDQQMETLKRNLSLTGSLSLGTLFATVLTQEKTLIGAAILLAGTKLIDLYKQNKEQEDKIKQLPSYFYWQVTRRAR